MKQLHLSNKAIRFLVIAIEAEKKRLEAIEAASDDDDEVADAGNDLELYRAIEADLRRALADH